MKIHPVATDPFRGILSIYEYLGKGGWGGKTTTLFLTKWNRRWQLVCRWDSPSCSDQGCRSPASPDNLAEVWDTDVEGYRVDCSKIWGRNFQMGGARALPGRDDCLNSSVFLFFFYNRYFDFYEKLYIDWETLTQSDFPGYFCKCVNITNIKSIRKWTCPT